MTKDLLRDTELEAALVGLGLNQHRLLYRPETQSTNIDVVQHYRQTGELSIATCETQTAGKGRRGRQWISPFAQNIYCTIGIKKSLPPSTLGWLSIVSGMALCRAMSSCGIDNVLLKWPNDLVYQKGSQKYKLGGILIESSPAESGYFVAIGFGLNVHMTQTELDAIPQAATSLSQISKRFLSRQSMLIESIAAVHEAIAQFDEVKIESLIGEFSRYDAFAEQKICVLNGDQKIIGRNAGVNHSGQLLLQTEQGELPFSAAEISLRAID